MIAKAAAPLICAFRRKGDKTEKINFRKNKYSLIYSSSHSELPPPNFAHETSRSLPHIFDASRD